MKTINMKLIGGIIMLFFQMQLRCQDIRTIYVDKSDRIKQFIMIDDKKAVALAEGTGRFKLTNTILLIENGRLIDSLVQRSSLDYIRLINESHLTVFRPTASLLNVFIRNNKLVLGDVNKIPYDKTIWSTNYNEAVLTFHNDITVSFNQGDVKENDLNPYDSTSTPLFKLYYDSEITDLNSPDKSAAFNHWPSYSKSVMPPMEMIKFIENDLVIVLSNIGEYFFINSKTKSVHIHNFPSKKSTSSWSLFYDHILRAEYLVSYNNDNSYDFYDKSDLSRSINTYPITGFADHIVKGHLLIKKKINGYDSYLLKSLK